MFEPKVDFTKGTLDFFEKAEEFFAFLRMLENSKPEAPTPNPAK